MKEFKAYDEPYYSKAIEEKRIRINAKPTTNTYKIKNGDLLTHSTIREEPPILDLPIKIIHEDDEFLVVEKPPSMIVHTGGGYHHNTLMAILYYEMKKNKLYVLHRLDRLTSGILLFAKNKEKSTKFH